MPLTHLMHVCVFKNTLCYACVLEATPHKVQKCRHCSYFMVCFGFICTTISTDFIIWFSCLPFSEAKKMNLSNQTNGKSRTPNVYIINDTLTLTTHQLIITTHTQLSNVLLYANLHVQHIWLDFDHYSLLRANWSKFKFFDRNQIVLNKYQTVGFILRT